MLLSIPQPINPYSQTQKKAFETLLYAKFTDKNNAPLALKREEIAMQYLGDIQKGAFDSDINSNKPNPNKHRGAIRALDNIGKNNIRGLYVGIKKEKGQEKEELQRPKLIGRLATTIIMKDGLWIG